MRKRSRTRLSKQTEDTMSHEDSTTDPAPASPPPAIDLNPAHATPDPEETPEEELIVHVVVPYEGTDNGVLTREVLQEVIRAELAVAVEKIVEEMHTDHDSMLNGLGGCGCSCGSDE